jgi:hypothetical protein
MLRVHVNHSDHELVVTLRRPATVIKLCGCVAFTRCEAIMHSSLGRAYSSYKIFPGPVYVRVAYVVKGQTNDMPNCYCAGSAGREIEG